jgi:hypothetical protein
MNRVTVLLILLACCVGLVVGAVLGRLGIWIGVCGGVGMVIGLLLSGRRARPTEPPKAQ